MAAKGRSATFARLFSIAGIAEIIAPHATVGEGFDAAFTVLKTAGLRDEYVYRAAVTHKILMGTHSLKTASMLTEFRTGSSKADLVILNGTATVYEIKSERDSIVPPRCTNCQLQNGIRSRKRHCERGSRKRCLGYRFFGRWRDAIGA